MSSKDPQLSMCNSAKIIDEKFLDGIEDLSITNIGRSDVLEIVRLARVGLKAEATRKVDAEGAFKMGGGLQDASATLPSAPTQTAEQGPYKPHWPFDSYPKTE